MYKIYFTTEQELFGQTVRVKNSREAVVTTHTDYQNREWVRLTEVVDGFNIPCDMNQQTFDTMIESGIYDKE